MIRPSGTLNRPSPGVNSIKDPANPRQRVPVSSSGGEELNEEELNEEESGRRSGAGGVGQEETARYRPNYPASNDGRGTAAGLNASVCLYGSASRRTGDTFGRGVTQSPPRWLSGV